jgi:mannose-1-phosphate guanylyltransferase
MTDKANIVVAPSDHLIMKEIDFIDAIKTGLDFVEKNDSLLTLGIKPSRPETGYGYIQIDEGDTNLRKVKTFTEKPNAELAQIFFETGEFFWNSGIFLWNLQTIDHAFHSLLPEVALKFDGGKDVYNTADEQKFIDEMYATCPNISIDYGIMEKAANVHVLCSDFGWTDLGTWGSLYEMSEKDVDANVTLKCKTMFYESKNNIVALPPDKLAVIQELDGYIVAESDNVLLICKLEDEQRIRQFVNDVNVNQNGQFS